MTAVEERVALGEVAALVGATAFGASEGALGDQAHEGMWIGRELSESSRVALEPRVAPQRLAAGG